MFEAPTPEQAAKLSEALDEIKKNLEADPLEDFALQMVMGSTKIKENREPTLKEVWIAARQYSILGQACAAASEDAVNAAMSDLMARAVPPSATMQ